MFRVCKSHLSYLPFLTNPTHTLPLDPSSSLPTTLLPLPSQWIFLLNPHGSLPKSRLQDGIDDWEEITTPVSKLREGNHSLLLLPGYSLLKVFQWPKGLGFLCGAAPLCPMENKSCCFLLSIILAHLLPCLHWTEQSRPVISLVAALPRQVRKESGRKKRKYSGWILELRKPNFEMKLTLKSILMAWQRLCRYHQSRPGRKKHILDHGEKHFYRFH